MKKTGFIRTGIVIWVILLVSLTGIARPDEKIKDLREKAARINRKIRKSNADVKRFTKKEKHIINSLHQADRALSKARNKAARSRNELAAIEKKIGKAEAESQKLMKQIQETEAYASQRLTALYKLNRLGKMSLLGAADSVTDFFQRKTALERILAHDQSILETLEDNKSRLQEMLKDLNARRKKKISLESAYKKQADDLSRKKARRTEILKHVRSQKSLTLASIKSLKQSAKALDQKIRDLMRSKVLETEKPVKLSSGKFSSLKGLLNMPVKGKIVSFYGPFKNTEFNVMNFQSGIDIKAKRGSPVYAVSEGKVLYSDWFRGYGNMLIIDHGEHYCTLYAHAEQILKKTGEHVKSGEMIATVGDTGSLKGPQLHFEVRRHGKSVDPVKWLKK